MREKLGILFLHHEINEVVLNNLASVRRQNPRATVVTMSAGPRLPRGYGLEATPGIKQLHMLNPNRSSDWLVCSWFLQRREKCQRWWIIEWDVYCSMPAQEYYRRVWDLPLVASSVRLRYREPEWRWFSVTKDFPEQYRPFAMGAVPFLFLVSDRALQGICKALIKAPPQAGNGEMRFCTAANWCGFPACGFSPPHDYISWVMWKTLPQERGIFHPVKHLVTEVQAGAVTQKRIKAKA